MVAAAGCGEVMEALLLRPSIGAGVSPASVATSGRGFMLKLHILACEYLFECLDDEEVGSRGVA